MEDTCLKTAILLFTQSPHNILNVKNLASKTENDDSNILEQIVGQHLMQTAKATGLPVYKVGTENLGSENFADKLIYAFERLFEMNYEQVIVIGNDYLHISTETLLNAQNLLKMKDIVVGPTFDGGSYLFGCSKNAYPYTDILDLRWGTNHLFEDVVMSAAIENLSIGFLPTEVVMDSPSDFQLCLQKYPPFESLTAQIEDLIDPFEVSLLSQNLPEYVDQRIFFTPTYTIPMSSIDGEEVFQFCLN